MFKKEKKLYVYPQRMRLHKRLDRIDLVSHATVNFFLSLQNV